MCTIECDTLFILILANISSPSEFFIEIFEIFFWDHLPNRDQELLELILIK